MKFSCYAFFPPFFTTWYSWWPPPCIWHMFLVRVFLFDCGKIDRILAAMILERYDPSCPICFSVITVVPVYCCTGTNYQGVYPNDYGVKISLEGLRLAWFVLFSLCVLVVWNSPLLDRGTATKHGTLSRRTQGFLLEHSKATPQTSPSRWRWAPRRWHVLFPMLASPVVWIHRKEFPKPIPMTWNVTFLP